MKRLLIIFFLMYSFTYASEKVAFGFAKGSSNSDIYTLALEKEFDYSLLNSSSLSLEFAFNYAEDNNDNLSIVSLQPMLNYELINKINFQVGAGVAYFSQKDLDHRAFGTNFQFKESIGFVYKFNNKLETSLKYVHYSNADMSSKNAGIDMHLLQLIYKF